MIPRGVIYYIGHYPIDNRAVADPYMLWGDSRAPARKLIWRTRLIFSLTMTMRMRRVGRYTRCGGEMLSDSGGVGKLWHKLPPPLPPSISPPHLEFLRTEHDAIIRLSAC
eukprot:gene25817-biopygen8945